MKKNKLCFLAALLLGSMIATGLSSCSDDDSSSGENKEINIDLADIKVVEEGEFNNKEFLQKAVQQAMSNNDGEDNEELLAFYQKALQEQEAYEAYLLDSLQAANPGNSIDALASQMFEGMRSGFHVLHHPGTLADGTEGTLSTLLVYPKSFWSDTNAKTIILGCHFTVTSDHEVPTKYKDLEISSDAHILTGEWVIPKGTSALLIMPDYEGYGVTSNRSHPYLSREVQARQCMESVAAAVKWFTNEHKQKFKDNCKMVSIGYSQGGAVSAATYRFYLEHKSEQWLKDVPPYVGAVCGDGPYDPLATVMTYINSNKLYMPVAPALVLKALCDTDPDMIKAGCQYKDFCTEGFMNTKIFERLASKRSTTDMCDNAIFAYADKHPDSLKYITENGRKVLPTDQAFNQATITYLKTGQLIRHAPEEKLRTLKNCLMKNSLLYNFTIPAGAKFTFFHSAEDEVVPYSNLQALLDTWGDSNLRAYKYETSTKTHVGTGRSFYLKYGDVYVYHILNNVWTSGTINISGQLY